FRSLAATSGRPMKAPATAEDLQAWVHTRGPLWFVLDDHRVILSADHRAAAALGPAFASGQTLRVRREAGPWEPTPSIGHAAVWIELADGGSVHAFARWERQAFDDGSRTLLQLDLGVASDRAEALVDDVVEAAPDGIL